MTSSRAPGTWPSATTCPFRLVATRSFFLIFVKAEEVSLLDLALSLLVTGKLPLTDPEFSGKLRLDDFKTSKLPQPAAL